MNIYKKASFTNGQSGGNPAGVAICENFSSDEEMLSIAADLGYSETVFAVQKESYSWKVRYFAPEQEVDFCGHATIALGAVLGEKFGLGRHALEINTGTISVAANDDGSATLVSPRTSHRPLPPAHRDTLLETFSLSDDDLDSDLDLCIVNGGNDHILIPLKTRETLAAMDYDLGAMKSFMQANQYITIALIWREDETTIHVRNAFAFGGVFEDPATGAAAAAISGYFRDAGLLEFENGAASLTFHQGDDMGMPSRLHTRISENPDQGIAVSGTVRTID